MRRAVPAILLLLATLVSPLVAAQDGPEELRMSMAEGTGPEVGSPFSPADTVLSGEGVTPGGAFLRSLILPGWGHAVTGNEHRGAMYAVVQSGAGWMLFKSLARRREAARFRDLEFGAARDRAIASGVTAPDTILQRANRDPRVELWNERVDTRSQQVEDWTALGIFLVLLGATDAFVAAHLMDRPEPLTIDVRPGAIGGWEFRLEVVPRRLRGER